MEDIQACVGAFHTSKAHNATTAAASANNNTKNGKKTKGKSKAAKSTNEESSSETTAADTADVTTTTANTEAQTAGQGGFVLNACRGSGAFHLRWNRENDAHHPAADSQRPQAADGALEKAIAWRRKLAKAKPNPDRLRRLAWLMVTDGHHLAKNRQIAVSNAENAVKMATNCQYMVEDGFTGCEDERD